jgi:hypothetical protein
LGLVQNNEIVARALHFGEGDVHEGIIAVKSFDGIQPLCQSRSSCFSQQPLCQLTLTFPLLMEWMPPPLRHQMCQSSGAKATTR